MESPVCETTTNLTTTLWNHNNLKQLGPLVGNQTEDSIRMRGKRTSIAHLISGCKVPLVGSQTEDPATHSLVLRRAAVFESEQLSIRPLLKNGVLGFVFYQAHPYGGLPVSPIALAILDTFSICLIQFYIYIYIYIHIYMWGITINSSYITFVEIHRIDLVYILGFDLGLHRNAYITIRHELYTPTYTHTLRITYILLPPSQHYECYTAKHVSQASIDLRTPYVHIASLTTAWGGTARRTPWWKPLLILLFHVTSDRVAHQVCSGCCPIHIPLLLVDVRWL